LYLYTEEDHYQYLLLYMGAHEYHIHHMYYKEEVYYRTNNKGH
jgi:hypothetical protein